MKDLEFFCVEIDHYTSEVPNHIKPRSNAPDMENQILRLFGNTAEGCSLCVHVHNYNPYFYIQVPQNSNMKVTEADLPNVKHNLASVLPSNCKEGIRSLTIDKSKRSLMFFTPRRAADFYSSGSARK